MRNSKEKYGETIGTKLEVYGVSGFFSLQMIGRQKGSPTEPDSKGVDEETG